MSESLINSRVSVFISHYSNAGLLGAVEDGTRAIIRQREISWGHTLALDDYVNKTWQALVIRRDPVREQLELSLRLAERDPWNDISVNYPLGKEVIGRVTGLITGAAFVELESGIEGYLSLKDIPIDSKQRIENFLWLQDRVKCTIEEVLPYQRHLRLSVKNLVARRDAKIRRQLQISNLAQSNNGATIAEFLPKEIRIRLLGIGIDDNNLRQQNRLQVLLIEEDEAFGAGIQSFLKHNACLVTLAKDSLTGLQNAQRQTPLFDLIILDWNLPFIQGHTMAMELQLTAKQSRVVVVLDPIHFQQHPEIREILRESDVDILAKSNGDTLKAGMLEILKELRKREFQSNMKRRRQISDFAISSYDAPSPDSELNLVSSEDGHREHLESVLNQLALKTRATTIAVMRLDSGRSNPVLEAFSGRAISLEDVSPEIMHSPLEDVLVQGKAISLDESTGLVRLQRLQSLLPSQGFLGVPVSSPELCGYGLILFKEMGSFTQYDSQQAHTAASLISQIMQERRLIRIFHPWQSQNLIGQLASSIVHEVNNKLGGIELLVQHLHDSIREMVRSPEKAEDATFLHGLEEDVEGIAKAQKSASELRDWYLGLTATDEQKTVCIKTLSEEMIRALRSQAQENNVILKLKTPKRLPLINARLSQLQQVFLNLMLNSIQQMAEAKQIGKLTIEISYIEGLPLPLQIRFKDEGPGIHFQIWENIFDFGFTTRKSGAGLGLTIARQAVTQMNGQLRVEESEIFWGTTFLLELPIGG